MDLLPKVLFLSNSLRIRLICLNLSMSVKLFSDPYVVRQDTTMNLLFFKIWYSLRQNSYHIYLQSEFYIASKEINLLNS